MRPLIKLLLAVIAVFFVMDGDKPPLAIADGCPGCASNSPIINPFPIMWLRWGTSKVLSGNKPTCDVDKFKDPRIGIKPIELHSTDNSEQIRGYQLIVADATNDAKYAPCEGADLVGVTYILSRSRSPVLIQQVALVEVVRDSNDVIDQRLNPYREYRLGYFI